MNRSNSALLLLLAGLILTAVSATPVSARTWYIKPDGTGDAPTIQAGVDSSAVLDTVLVAPGTYHDCTHSTGEELNCVNVDKSITLLGEAGPEQTIIDAQGLGRVISVPAYVRPLIQGFTITGGTAHHGGGVLLYRNAMTLKRCVLKDNQAFFGGGLYSDAGAFSDGPHIIGCVIEHNTASKGGGLNLEFGPLEVQSCVIRHNTSTTPGYGAFDGWAILPVTMTASVVVDNYSPGLTIYGHHDPVIDLRGVTFAGNVEPQIYLQGAVPDFSRVLCVGTYFCRNDYDYGFYEHCNFYGTWNSSCLTQWYTPNLDADPLFCDLTGGDYTLDAASPCLPENNAWGVLVGALARGCSITASPEGRLSSEAWSRVKARYR
jgi:hypothetical protein